MDESVSPPMLKLEVDIKRPKPSNTISDLSGAFGGTFPPLILNPTFLPQPAGEVVMKRPSNPGELPRVNGINIVSNSATTNDIDTIRDNLQDMGIETKSILYMKYPEGQRGVFIYGLTIHGQWVFVELPLGTVVNFGDLEIEIQRAGVVTSSLQENFREQLKDIHTGYIFVTTAGMHYVKSKKQINATNSQEPIIYDYSDYELADSIFQLKKYQFLIVPAVHYANLIEPARLNTIEAYIDMQLKGGDSGNDNRGGDNVEGNRGESIAKELVIRSNLATLLTMKGPFTVFLPNEEVLKNLLNASPERIRSVLLAHIVMGKIDPVSPGNSPNNSPRDSTKQIKLVALAQNEIYVDEVKGKIVAVSSGKVRSKIAGPPVRKYNGVIYSVDALFTPASDNFKMPEKSDFDDVVTIFDISRSTMEIRKAEYAINRHNQEQFLTVLGFIGDISTKLFNAINVKSDTDGMQLLQHSNELMDLFYTKEVPCADRCIQTEKLSEVIKEENIEFENVLRASNAFGALRIPVEHIYQKLLRIDQKLHVKGIIGLGNKETE